MASHLQLLDDALPGAFHERGVTGRQVGAGQMQVEHWLAHGLVAGVEELQRLGCVRGAETRLLAGRAVLGIEYVAVSKQGVFGFHVHGSESCNKTVATR
jgi:hypothetical protein